MFFAICELQKPGHNGRSCSKTGDDFAYCFSQFTTNPPPLSPVQQASWTRLDAVERSLWRIEDERGRLKREKDSLSREKQSM